MSVFAAVTASITLLGLLIYLKHISRIRTSMSSGWSPTGTYKALSTVIISILFCSSQENDKCTFKLCLLLSTMLSLLAVLMSTVLKTET